jgi:alpha-glucosidase (family GH31 glycosyl hydrolase)
MVKIQNLLLCRLLPFLKYKIMIMRLLMALLFAVLSVFPVVAQKSTGKYTGGLSRNGNVFSWNSEQTKMQIEFCNGSVVRVRTSFTGNFEADEPWMVVQYKWPSVQVSQTENSAELVWQSDSLQVKLTKSNGAISIYKKNGQLLSGDADGGGMVQNDKPLATKILQPDENFFGFGERMDFLNQRGKKLKLDVGRGKGRPHEVGAYNVLEANYCPVPFFMSTKGYGIFFHNSFATNWDMGHSNPAQYSFGADGGELDYYVMYGPGFGEILNQYTTITGKAPLMPKFALGLHIGTYSGGTWGHEQYTSDTYVLLLALKLRAMGIPVDILHLDSVWRIFGSVGGKGATSFEWRLTFRNPKGMFDSLYAMGFNMVGLHIRPRFDNGTKLKLLDTAQQLGFTYPENGKPGEFVNFFDQKAVDWWWQQGVKRVADQGAMFLKTDEGSAFGSLANESDKVGPTGKDAQRLHNIFPIAYAKAPYEKFAANNKLRGMNHTREGYAGIQRFPFIFAGDWPSEWQYFAPVIKAGLNIGISGVGNWAHCMGGFEHVADPELYIRWTQFGLMSPVAHLFGMDHPAYKEPWNYGEEALSIFKHYDSLRYRLIPYLYSHQYEMYKTGMPMMRALVLHYPDDVNVYDITDQYLFGNSMMVCPVTTKGAKTRTVYLPEGDWYDYHTGKKYAGKQYVHVVTPIDILPMFVKSGGIIPMQPGMAYVGQKPVDTLTVEVYPGNGKFTLYEDDERTTKYQQGEFALSEMTMVQDGKKLTLDIGKPAGNFFPEKHVFVLKIRAEEKPVSVLVNGKSFEGNYDTAGKWLTVKGIGDNSGPMKVKVEW